LRYIKSFASISIPILTSTFKVIDPIDLYVSSIELQFVTDKDDTEEITNKIRELELGCLTPHNTLTLTL
jgi:hypothetical protein